jgi:hypothetical protein
MIKMKKNKFKKYHYFIYELVLTKIYFKIENFFLFFLLK